MSRRFALELGDQASAWSTDPAGAWSLPASSVFEEDFFSGRGGIYHWSREIPSVVAAGSTTDKFLRDQW